MISSLVIVFREMLEMVLVVGVLMAATRGMPGSRHWIALGVFGGLMGALFCNQRPNDYLVLIH